MEPHRPRPLSGLSRFLSAESARGEPGRPRPLSGGAGPSGSGRRGACWELYSLRRWLLAGLPGKCERPLLRCLPFALRAVCPACSPLSVCRLRLARYVHSPPSSSQNGEETIGLAQTKGERPHTSTASPGAEQSYGFLNTTAG